LTTGKEKRNNERCGWQIFNIGLWSQNEAQLSLRRIHARGTLEKAT